MIEKYYNESCQLSAKLKSIHHNEELIDQITTDHYFKIKGINIIFFEFLEILLQICVFEINKEKPAEKFSRVLNKFVRNRVLSFLDTTKTGKDAPKRVWPNSEKDQLRNTRILEIKARELLMKIIIDRRRIRDKERERMQMFDIPAGFQDKNLSHNMSDTKKKSYFSVRNAEQDLDLLSDGSSSDDDNHDSTTL